jgi:quercetin dioxygenase-like cupin family protein
MFNLKSFIANPPSTCNTVSKHMKKIRELTAQLDDWTPARSTYNTLEVKVETGHSIAYGIFKDPRIAVCHVVDQPGTVYQAHSHTEIEIIIVFAGKHQISFANRIQNYGPGQIAIIPPGNNHQVTAIELTESIVVTIPAHPMFPEAPKNEYSK